MSELRRIALEKDEDGDYHDPRSGIEVCGSSLRAEFKIGRAKRIELVLHDHPEPDSLAVRATTMPGDPRVSSHVQVHYGYLGTNFLHRIYVAYGGLLDWIGPDWVYLTAEVVDGGR